MFWFSRPLSESSGEPTIYCTSSTTEQPDSKVVNKLMEHQTQAKKSVHEKS